MNLLDQLRFLYGADKAPKLWERVREILADHRKPVSARENALTERDVILITYPDQVRKPGQNPLRVLNHFCLQFLTDVISAIHVLPFCPSSSDDGFSVIDYRQVDPALGDWRDIAAIQDSFQLMFDAVINHVSAQSFWFRSFLQGDLRYRDHFIEPGGSDDLSKVVRPRALPLLTSFSTPSGVKRVWTTFGPDQIDLNFSNPEVLLEILDVLLTYVDRGATFLRLDAIAYLWKQAGTKCIHLPQTHHLIQFFRSALDEVAPHVRLITETNVPHVENLSYFGNGFNEAQLVYNFALPPIVLHTFYTQDSTALSRWAASLRAPSDHTTFLNFLASHDGIGLNPLRGILSSAEIDALVQNATVRGALISHRYESDGAEVPYELNVNYFDALGALEPGELLDLHVDRFLAAQAIMLSLVGVPAVYFHSLFGSRGWWQGVNETGRNRSVNREKCDLTALQQQLSDPTSLRSKVFSRYSQLISVRRTSPAFHPHGGQRVLEMDPSVLALERTSPSGDARMLVLINVSPQSVVLAISVNAGVDLLGDTHRDGNRLILKPYQISWIKV